MIGQHDPVVIFNCRARKRQARKDPTKPGIDSNFLYLVPPGAVALAWSPSGAAPDIRPLMGGMIAVAGVVMLRFDRQPGPQGECVIRRYDMVCAGQPGTSERL